MSEAGALDWPLVPIGSLASVAVSTVDKKSYGNEVSVKLVNYTDVYYNDEILPGEYMSATASEEQVRRFSVRAGDVAITKDSETSNDIGIPAFVPEDLPGHVWGYHLAIYRARDPRYGRFLKWFFEAAETKAELEKRTPGVTRVGLGQTTLRYLRVARPDPDDARVIARYLDRETAEIDAFIADQEQLISLLEERRRGAIWSLTTGASDTGLSKRADWLGDVPHHWRVSRLSRFFTVVLGKMLDAKQMTGESSAPYIRAANISEQGLRLDGLNQMDFDQDERQRLRLREGDLLVVEGGAIGVNVVLDSDLDGVFFQKTVNRVRARADASTRFLGYQLDLARWTGTIDMLSNKSTIAHLTAEKLERLTVALPPKGEQQAIVVRLDEETASTDAAIADAREAITFSKERRAALISAAVTGRIDVTERKRLLM